MKLRIPTTYVPHRPSPKQAAFLMFDGLEAFYGGAAGGGKSDALLMGALQYVDQPDYSAILFRRSYTDLALSGALMDRAKSWLTDTPARWDRETHTYHFPSGASLSFGYIQTPSDKWRYQSAEFQYVGWDEVTEWADDDAYTFMFSRLRRLKNSDVPLRVRSASNPSGAGATWVRKRFIENPTEDRIFIPATFQDNPHLDKESYLRSLQELPEATQKRLIEGSWEEIDSAAFPMFDPEIHVVPEMRIPHSWRRWESMDFGTTNPTAWLHAGLQPEGYAVIAGEYYQPGLISSHSSAILTLRENVWGQPSLALCDPSIQNRTGFGSHGRGETVHSEFSKNGLYLVPANNDRRAGFIRINELLKRDPSLAFPDWHERAGQLGSPSLFITKDCPVLIEQLRHAPLDGVLGEHIDPFWESRHGHAMAAARYLLTAKIFPDKQEVYEPKGMGRSSRQFGEWNTRSDWKQLA